MATITQLPRKFDIASALGVGAERAVGGLQKREEATKAHERAMAVMGEKNEFTKALLDLKHGKEVEKMEKTFNFQEMMKDKDIAANLDRDKFAQSLRKDLNKFNLDIDLKKMKEDSILRVDRMIEAGEIDVANRELAINQQLKADLVRIAKNSKDKAALQANRFVHEKGIVKEQIKGRKGVAEITTGAAKEARKFKAESDAIKWANAEWDRVYDSSAEDQRQTMRNIKAIFIANGFTPPTFRKRDRTGKSDNFEMVIQTRGTKKIEGLPSGFTPD